MPIIIETEDGRTFGPGQPYGYQGQYQGQRQPGIETANMRSVPQRTIQDEVRKYSNESTGSGWTPDRGDFARRFRDPDTTTVPEGFNAPDRFGRMRPTQANNPYAGRINNNPMGGANIGGGWNQYEGGPNKSPWEYYNLRNTTPMSSGSYLSSMYGGGLDDAAGMNESARGMIEGAGFDVAGGPGMVDKRMTDKLWGKAVNKFPPGTPKPVIVQEWERLQEEYWRLKDQQGYRPGVT